MINYNGRKSVNLYSHKSSMGGGIYSFSKNKNVPVPPPPTEGYLLQENGFAILQENGGHILVT